MYVCVYTSCFWFFAFVCLFACLFLMSKPLVYTYEGKHIHMHLNTCMHIHPNLCQNVLSKWTINYGLSLLKLKQSKSLLFFLNSNHCPSPGPPSHSYSSHPSSFNHTHTPVFKRMPLSTRSPHSLRPEGSSLWRVRHFFFH